MSLSLIIAAAALAAPEGGPRGPGTAASATADAYPRRARAIGPERWIRLEDYPERALRDFHEGTTRVRYVVGRDGRVRDCRVERSSGHAELDLRSCAVLIQRARFLPGIGLDLQPIEETLFQNITWRISITDFPRASFFPGYGVLRLPPLETPIGPDCLRASRPLGLVPLAIDICAELQTYLPSAGPSGRPEPTLALISLARADGSFPVPLRTIGQSFYREEATFEIAENGAVAGCRATVTRRGSADQYFDLCRFLETEDGPYFRRGPARAATPAKMSIELFRLERELSPIALQSLVEQPQP